MDDLPHPLHIVLVIASIKACCAALLGEVMEAFSQVVAVHNLAVADPVGLGGVYRPPGSVLTTDAGAGIGPTPSPVTAGVLIVWHIVARVDCHAHSLLVALKRVILWTPVSIDKIGITIIHAPLSRVGLASLISCDILYVSQCSYVTCDCVSWHFLLRITWHVDPVHGSIALAAHVAHVHIIGPDIVGQVGLPVHEGVTADIGSSCGQVHPTSSVKTEAIV